jgi:toxin CptA
MDLMIQGLAFAIAALCAALMGFAIQRGGTCTVAAVEELVQRRGATRLLALIEASAWVGGGLLVLDHLGALPRMPGAFALSAGTLAGAAMLGLGAFVNRACVFGAIARFGSGEWAYAATPVGFYAGSLVAVTFAPAAAAMRLDAPSLLFGVPGVLTWAVLAFVAWRIGAPLHRHRGMLRAWLGAHAWTPHAATLVIGVTFIATWVLAGAWAYTDALADLARGATRDLAARLLLAACLLAGAAIGGWTAGRFRAMRVEARTLLRCFAGGAAMGWGSAWIPGSNDGLVLIGLPLLRPYAWAAFATMCLSIGVAMWARMRLARGLPAARA